MTAPQYVPADRRATPANVWAAARPLRSHVWGCMDATLSATIRTEPAEQPLKRILGWSDISALVESLLRSVDNDYDALLVITRGGMVPACLLSERLDLRNILVAAVQLYTGIGQTLDAPIFLQFPNDTLLSGKRVLIVDDVWDSGRTAVAVRERVRLAGGLPHVAVLHFKPRASRFPGDQPDHFAEITDDWIVYPWDDER